MSQQGNGGVGRISVSLPETLLLQLDEMVSERGFDSRSQAIAEMISHQVTLHKKERGNEIMAGTITLLYDHSTPRLQKTLADLQHDSIARQRFNPILVRSENSPSAAASSKDQRQGASLR